MPRLGDSPRYGPAGRRRRFSRDLKVCIAAFPLRASLSRIVSSASGLEVTLRPSGLLGIIEKAGEGLMLAKRIFGQFSVNVSHRANILRTVGSAHFALRRRVESVREAIALLGLRRIVDVVTLAAVADVIRNDCPATISAQEHSGAIAWP